MNFESNQLIDNRYKIIEKLGEGGMGTVWKALDTRVNDEVVLKLPLKYHDPEMLTRFHREATTMRKHAGGCVNILDIQDIGHITVNKVDQVPYYVMRFQAVGPLRDWQPPRDSADNIIFDRKSWDWIDGIATALDYLHDRRTYHRDVKPENILFNSGGTPLLSDFGIVKELEKATASLTGTSQSLGTLAYMPPEILRGQPFTGQSDQYSFAATVYEMIAGERPYGGTTPFALFESITRGHRSLIEIVPQLTSASSAAMDKALAEEPADRFASCRQFAEAFLAGLSGQQAGPVSQLPVVAPSEDETGLLVTGTPGGGEMVGGKPIAPGNSYGGSDDGLFSGGGRVVAKKPEVAPVENGPTIALVGIAALLLALISGGVYLSSKFSGGGSPATGVSSGALRGSPAPVKEPESSVESINPLSYEEYKEASFELVSEHAHLGFPEAENRLGVMYNYGEGVQRDDVEAVKWYRKAAEQGNMFAQFSLSHQYEYGFSVEKDETKAFNWLRKSAQQGYGKAQNFLAMAYEFGTGVEVDGKSAVYWYQKSAEQGGDGFAELQLGELYEEGLIVEQNLALAKKWYRRAEELGETKASKRLKFLFGNLAPELTGVDQKGVKFQLSDYRGKVIWLNLWSIS